MKTIRCVVRRLGATLLVLSAALALGGCPALIVPSLAYQGLKSSEKQNASASASSSKSSHRRTSTQSSQPADDHNIE